MPRRTDMDYTKADKVYDDYKKAGKKLRRIIFLSIILVAVYYMTQFKGGEPSGFLSGFLYQWYNENDITTTDSLKNLLSIILTLGLPVGIPFIIWFIGRTYIDSHYSHMQQREIKYAQDDEEINTVDEAIKAQKERYEYYKNLNKVYEKKPSGSGKYQPDKDIKYLK